MTRVVDSHIHTSLCRHASGEPAEYVARARAAGLAGIVFTDHAPAPDGYDAENRMVLDQFDEYVRMVADVRRQAPGFVGFGVEADYYGGCEAFLGPWLGRQELDLVLGSVHYIGEWPFDHSGYVDRWNRVDVREAWREYFRLVCRLADARLYDVLAHPDLPKKFGYRPPDADLTEMAAPALDRLAAAGMAMEINTSGLRRTVREIYPSPLLLRLARERDIPICFGSDSHAPDDVGREFAQAVRLAREAGYVSYVRFARRARTPTPLPPDESA